MISFKTLLSRIINLKQGLKLIRNDLILNRYKRIKTYELDFFLERNKSLKNKNIAVIIAFEQPSVLNWLLCSAKIHFKDAVPIVFDNSQRINIRNEIKKLCITNHIEYLALPTNKIRHANRSHGMALTWVYYNIIQKIQPKFFAIIDHDLIPFKDIYFSKYLKNQPFYGAENLSKQECWNLWAGYSIFDFSNVKHSKLNFLQDFWRGLDTGGRNWGVLYKFYNKNKVHFASNKNIQLHDEHGNSHTINIIDNKWIHIGGASYRSQFINNIDYYEKLIQSIKK